MVLLILINTVLGPGAYTQNTAIGSNAPAFSMSGRVDKKLESDVPGPGMNIDRDMLDFGEKSREISFLLLVVGCCEK